MKKTIISIVALSMIQFQSETVLAQDKTTNKNKEQGEIVMTQEELDSFLEKIAQHKRNQLEKRRNELIHNRKVNEHVTKINTDKVATEKITANVVTQDIPTPSVTVDNNSMLLRELDRINSRIDMLMLNSGNNNRTYVHPNYVPNPAPNPVIYSQPAVPVTQPVTLPISGTTTYQNTDNGEVAALRNRVDALNEELRVLNALSNNGKDAAYERDIAALNNRIKELDAALIQKSEPVNQTKIYTIHENDELRKGLEHFNQKVYFANNSTTLSPADIAALKQVVAIVKKNSPRVTAVLRGFASSKGSAMYNNTISFNRAEAVKKVLLDHGLSATDIITMHHGIDDGKDEAAARRVEITLLVQ